MANSKVLVFVLTNTGNCEEERDFLYLDQVARLDYIPNLQRLDSQNIPLY